MFMDIQRIDNCIHTLLTTYHKDTVCSNTQGDIALQHASMPHVWFSTTKGKWTKYNDIQLQQLVHILVKQKHLHTFTRETKKWPHTFCTSNLLSLWKSSQWKNLILHLNHSKYITQNILLLWKAQQLNSHNNWPMNSKLKAITMATYLVLWPN